MVIGYIANLSLAAIALLSGWMDVVDKGTGKPFLKRIRKQGWILGGLILVITALNLYLSDMEARYKLIEKDFSEARVELIDWSEKVGRESSSATEHLDAKLLGSVPVDLRYDLNNLNKNLTNYKETYRIFQEASGKYVGIITSRIRLSKEREAEIRKKLDTLHNKQKDESAKYDNKLKKLTREAINISDKKEEHDALGNIKTANRIITDSFYGLIFTQKEMIKLARSEVLD